MWSILVSVAIAIGALQDAQPEPYAGFEVEAPNNQRKIYVSEVEERGKAHGKLKRGDLLISVNRKSITSVEQLREMIAKSKVGDKLEVKVKRRTPDGSRIPFETVTVEFEVFVDTRIKQILPDGGVPGFRNISGMASPIVVVGPKELENSVALAGEPNLNFFIRFQIAGPTVRQATLHFNWRGPVSTKISAAEFTGDQGTVRWDLAEFDIDDQAQVERAPTVNLGNGQSFKAGTDNVFRAKYCTKILTAEDVAKLRQLAAMNGPLRLAFEGNKTAVREFSPETIAGIQKALEFIEQRQIPLAGAEQEMKDNAEGKAGEEWSGKWTILGEDGKVATTFDLKPNGVATKAHAPKVGGKWTLKNDELLIEWSDGWRDVLVSQNGQIVKRAFAPGINLTDPPSNTQTAQRQ